MLPKPAPVPISVGGRALVDLPGPWIVRADEDSVELLALADPVAGGGPGGGGGSGIPGSQPLFGDDGFLCWLGDLDGTILFTAAPAEAALRDAGGLAGASSCAPKYSGALSLRDGDGKGCS